MSGNHYRLGFLPLPALMAVAGGLAAGTLLSLGPLSPPGRFPSFTFVQGINIGGLSEREAMLLLQERLRPLLDFKVTLVVKEERKLFTTWRVLGASLDIERALKEAKALLPRGGLAVPYTLLRPIPVSAFFDEGKLSRFLKKLGRETKKEPKDAQLIWLGQGRRRIIPERFGFGIKVEEAARLIKEVGKWPRAAKISLPFEVLKPRVTAKDLQSVTAVIEAFTTYFNPASRNRAHNVRLAARRLKGVVVMPGEVFSFNRAVGPRTRALGYLPAPIFVRGKKAIGIGGGACQVSTTLYNAAKKAGMRIVERHFHSLPVDYVPPGYDATVVYGALDMKFKNLLPRPIVIWTEVKGGRLTTFILGPPRGSV